MWTALLLLTALATPPAPLDLGRATAADLERLPGVGPKRAQAILALRARRPFRRVRDLLRVRGIGPKSLARLRPLVRVGPAAPRTTRIPQRAGGVRRPCGTGRRGHPGVPP